MNIAVAGTGYVGLSLATLLAQKNHVTAVDVVKEKVDLINNRKSVDKLHKFILCDFNRILSPLKYRLLKFKVRIFPIMSRSGCYAQTFANFRILITAL